MAGWIQAIGQFVGGIASVAGSQGAEEIEAVAHKDQVKSIRDVSETEAAALERKQSYQRGTGYARIGASGITMSGSALDVTEDMVEEMALNVENQLFRGEMRIAELRQQRAMGKYTTDIDNYTTIISAGTRGFAYGAQAASDSGWFGSGSSGGGGSPAAQSEGGVGIGIG